MVVHAQHLKQLPVGQLRMPLVAPAMKIKSGPTHALAPGSDAQIDSGNAHRIEVEEQGDSISITVRLEN